MGSDFKRTLMWVILCAACFMLWDNWQVYNGQPSFFGGSATQTAQTQEPQPSADAVPDNKGSGAEAGGVQAGDRVLVTTLTKRMAESLTEYLQSMDIRVRYLHSDVTTMDRMALIRGLRLGEYDVLVGINLLREGLDLPEVSLVAILDADKEGFLRSETSLVQTIGRAARNVDGRVIMYADVMTDSLMRAISETNRRRAIQEEYNRVHGITPESVRNAVHQVLEITKKAEESAPAAMSEDERNALMKQVEDQMLSAAKALDFEQAAKLRDQLLELKGEKPQAEQIQKKRRRTRESTRHH